MEAFIFFFIGGVVLQGLFSFAMMADGIEKFKTINSYLNHVPLPKYEVDYFDSMSDEEIHKHKSMASRDTRRGVVLLATSFLGIILVPATILYLLGSLVVYLVKAVMKRVLKDFIPAFTYKGV